MRIAHYCMDNPEHVFKGSNLDGIRCPFCDGLVMKFKVSVDEYKVIPKYRDIKKIRELQLLIFKNTEYRTPICSCDIERVLEIEEM